LKQTVWVIVETAG